MTALTTMRQALADPELLGSVLPGESWAAWRMLLIAINGEVLTDDERPTFTKLTGRDVEPLERVEEFWGVIGRRGGKTRAAAALAAYQAALVDHSNKLVVGERGVIVLLAATMAQARVAYRYISGLFDALPLLSDLVEGRTEDTLSLTNGIDIQVRPASFRSIRGLTAIMVIGDEAAFWQVDGAANPDTEILNALRPALATTGGPLIVISSPYARRGEVYATWKRNYGPTGDPLILVAHGASRDLNPLLNQKVIDRAMERDSAAASAEYLAQFRSDVEAFLTMEAVGAVACTGRLELPPRGGVRYLAWVDPSGGSSDSFTLAIAHREGDLGVLDAVRERRPPFSPEAVVEEFVALLKTYGISRVVGDRYAGEWPRERFRVHGITYDLAERTASECYQSLLPLINGGRAELLDNPRLTAQLVALERRTSRVGRDSIAHPPGGHDDLANAAAGALVLAAAKPRGLVITDEMLARAATQPAMNDLARARRDAAVMNRVYQRTHR